MDYIMLDLQKLLHEVKQEIEATYVKCKGNKKFKYANQAKKDWYYRYLQERIQHKIYEKYKLTVFGMMERFINSILPKTINKQFNQFTDVRNIGLGDKI